ncbi:MAG: hypothetical protein AMXMBFR83_14760 [Phycisphaerae bacterium]|jgi:predicted RNA-binding Zn-ribbon protein involved in translation (DUF1610 family)
MALLAVGVVGLIGWTARVIYTSAGSDPQSISLVKALACAACGHRYEASVSRPPLKCPACGQETVWPAVRCADCGTVWACDRRKYRAEGKDPYCPKCRSTQLVSVQAGS